MYLHGSFHLLSESTSLSSAGITGKEDGPMERLEIELLEAGNQKWKLETRENMFSDCQ